MKLLSYVVARDYGFAPNPFHGACTLATCKPVIRRTAEVGDWIVGTGSATYGLTGHRVFAMCVDQAMTFDQYWSSHEFQLKKPYLSGSRKQAFGDNIYHRDSSGHWYQAPSHHSEASGEINQANVEHDTQSDRVLIGREFTYFGKSAVPIPEKFQDVCAVRGHKCNFEPAYAVAFIEWLKTACERGFQGAPAEWPHT